MLNSPALQADSSLSCSAGEVEQLSYLSIKLDHDLTNVGLGLWVILHKWGLLVLNKHILRHAYKWLFYGVQHYSSYIDGRVDIHLGDESWVHRYVQVIDVSHNCKGLNSAFSDGQGKNWEDHLVTSDGLENLSLWTCYQYRKIEELKASSEIWVVYPKCTSQKLELRQFVMCHLMTACDLCKVCTRLLRKQLLLIQLDLTS